MDFLETILTAKKAEIENLAPVHQTINKKRPSFYQYVKGHPEKIQIIAEIKRASPSKGAINLAVDPLEQAKNYENAGVAAISVLTDPVFFKGTIQDLADVAAVVDLPLLCKDFIISKQQIDRAKIAGASLILLIVAALEPAKLKELHEYAESLNLEILVETHNAEELALAKSLPAKVIGVNNRDLKTFEVTLETSLNLAQTDDETIYISESGFKTTEDVAQVKENYQAVLVGETLMKAGNILEKIQALQVIRQ
ncbi:indole-3-glycerol phosphate synthase TrpC [Enterococcus alishanensis]|uniref:Indole-3-glycerol phosphate synthase n=1 Tax=Enterococcus alishanensis TaxID=1303817 RepID=A0ABS6TD63_9ENTE|nr:indole-3-glycerol phosphate synthase TrpC [Enterococcus alishanensis]MBV7390858.1 indole-3-glycerol phosphate synthase TrpC [Enterococcus alishanensis]